MLTKKMKRWNTLYRLAKINKEVKKLLTSLNNETLNDFETSINTFKEEVGFIRIPTEDKVLEILSKNENLRDVNDLAILWYKGFRTTQQILDEDPEAWLKKRKKEIKKRLDE